ncbi:trans-Golgi network-localized SYP41-interacting protein 1-like [Prosopis cineraria]|uniref:trans-Golgi network-localized SYP41-interacting protein 1-like n=1 Tax=Prosopis cineraria TaxID=364024 RepID=UPI002410466B|nr:trans-Golgi network-localized SYP41-interacting protein 1-like [Prosopis cineraria]XP_054807241.1 trans-Golgi network-localized SYP41-interacting protein 1-like [Prosopis cineraria]XP_054807242.1 trans-Golgi network-localized SYP41-interacting protein 1-like [Prosopis cineraria]
MSENLEHKIVNHESGQHSEGYEAAGGSQEQNVEGISNENEYLAMNPDTSGASDLGHDHAAKTEEQSNGTIQSPPEPSTDSNQIESVDLDNAALIGTAREDHVDKRSTDTAKDDAFVDYPNGLNTYDVRKIDTKEEVEVGEAKEKSEANRTLQRPSYSGELGNEVRDGYLTHQQEQSQHSMVKTVTDEDSIAQQYKEERETLAQVVLNLHRQLKALAGEESLPNDANVEVRDQEVQMANIPTKELMNECLEFAITTSEERSNAEATMRHLQSLLSMKDKEILDLNTKVAVSLVSQDVAECVASSFDSNEKNSEVQLEKYRNIEIVMDKIILSIATVVNQEQVLDDSVSGKIVHIEKGTSLLIENYNQIKSEIEQFAQSFSKVALDTRENCANNILVAACDELLGLKRKEAELVEKVAHLDDENQEMVEELDKVRALTRTLNAELENMKTELEQYKVNYANTKEKLSKAVGKGKALILKRETLKQSLVAKSTELEACLMELKEKSDMLEAAEITKEELVRSENMIAFLKNSLEQSNTFFEKAKEILSETEPDKPELSDEQERLRWLVDDRNMLKDAFLEFEKLQDALSLMDMPEPVSSSNLESQINWLSGFFRSARDDMNVLHEEISTIKGSAQDCIDHLSLSLLMGFQEKYYLQAELANLRDKYGEIFQKSLQISQEKDYIVKTLVELSNINMADNNIDLFSSDTFAIINLCFQMIKQHRGPSPEMLERIKSLLYLKDSELTLYGDVLEDEILIRSEMNKLSNELKVAREEILRLKEEKGSLQKDLGRSEEKAALLRDKLSMAVNKGKGLVQDRDNLKSFLDEKTLGIEQLKLDIQNQESVISNYREQINRLSQELESIPKLKSDLLSMENERNQFEQFLLERNNLLQRLAESINGIVLPVDLVFEKPVQKVRWLAGYVSECLNAKLLAEKELQLVKEGASVSERISAEAQENVKSMEKALSSSENSIFQLAEEKRELEVEKMNVQEELQKVKEEAAEVCMSVISLKDTLLQTENSIYILSNEKEQDQDNREAVDTDLERVKEEATPQTCKLADARKNIEDIENALSGVKSDVILLTGKHNNDQIIKTNMENELEKWQDEADYQARKLKDSSETIKSLNDALLKAQDDISILEDANKLAKEEISTLQLKLNSCLDELAGKGRSFHNESVELIGFLNDLQVLIKEDTLSPRVKQSLEKKFESLKTMDLLIENTRDRIYDMTGMEPKRHLTLDEDLLVRKDLSNGIERFDDKSENSEINDADIDGIISLFGKLVKEFQVRNKLIAEKFDAFSVCIDELVTLLSAKLQELKTDVETTFKYMETLKEKANTMEILRDKKEKTIDTLENDIEILMSACIDSTRELQIEIERHVMESDSNFEVEKFKNEKDVQESNQQNNKYMEAAQKLINATRITQTFLKQFELRSKEVAATVEDLQNRLNGTRVDLDMVVEERDLNQNRSVQLESDIQVLRSSSRELRNDLADYHALQDKLKEKETEILSLHSTLSAKEQGTERSLLSTSEVRALSGEIDKIEIPVMESEEDMESHTSATVEKLFHIIDFVTSLEQHMNSLSRDKEELHLTIDKKVLEVKRLKAELNQLNRDWEDSKNGKNDDSELTFSLEKILDMLGGSDWNEDKKSAGVKGLMTVLDKQVATILLVSEKLKARDQELSSKLLGSQKVIDELTTKVKLLEHSLQNGTSQPEIHQERSVFEVASLPVASEISEIEKGSLGMKAKSSIPPASHMLNMRKGSTDHLAVDIDSESNSLIKEANIDDKGHLFKSLNTTGFVPKRGKLIADRLDGIWVSSGQALMSRPRARLGVIGYLFILHVWLLGTIL